MRLTDFGYQGRAAFHFRQASLADCEAIVRWCERTLGEDGDWTIWTPVIELAGRRWSRTGIRPNDNRVGDFLMMVPVEDAPFVRMEWNHLPRDSFQ